MQAEGRIINRDTESLKNAGYAVRPLPLFFKDFTHQTSILMLKNSQEAPNDHQRIRKTNELVIFYVVFI